MKSTMRSLVVCTVVASAALLGGCDGGSDTGSGTTTTDTTTDTTTGEGCEAKLQANKDLAIQVSEDVFLGGAPSDGVLSKDFVAHFPSGQPDQDLQGFLGFAVQFRAAFPDAAFTFTHEIAKGDLVALRYIGTGTQKGPIFGVPATGKAIKWEGMVVRRISGGLVVEEWNEPDNASLIGQLTSDMPAPSPESTDHRAAGDCTEAVTSANETVALRVSNEVVLGGAAPDELLSPDFVMHNPNGLPDQDLAGFLGFNAGFRAAFPDAQFTFTHQIGEGDLVLLRYTAKGTHSAEIFGVPATGKKITWEGAVIRRIEGGKAAEEWNAPDIAGMMAQLTAM